VSNGPELIPDLSQPPEQLIDQMSNLAELVSAVGALPLRG
jgi:hypothetical protein